MNTFNENSPGSSGSGMNNGPSTGGFWRNLALIRPVAWVVAAGFFIGFQLLFWLAIWPHTHEDEMSRMSDAARICLPLLASTVGFIYVLLIGFVYVDAKRRGMRYVMWTLLACLIPNTVGIILYFIMRDPMPTPCPKCNKLSAASFTFCPHCGAELMRTCKACHKKLGVGWSNCAYCGTPVTGQAGSPAPPAIA
jgi:cytochrome bd-type quinol oxidase subunit 2